MRLIILDIIQESKATCYLCKVNLIDYIQSIPETYKDFDVQRGIVTNRYLDHLADTIYKKKHIPPIVLIASNFKVIKNKSELDVNSYQILDGLQRTHRLKVIWDVVDYLIHHEDVASIKDSPSQFSRANSTRLRALGGDVKLVRSLIDFNCLKLNATEDFFEGNVLWLEIWTELGESEQVEKMLLLNAGHKSVNIKHQLELLFLSTLVKLEDISPKGVEFIREKDQSAIQYSKSRKLGQYHFSHIISALIALSAGRIINTNTDFISDLQSDQSNYVELVEGFNLEFIKVFIEFIYNLDQALYKTYKEMGTKWIGREVVLIGIFAAIGEFAEERSQSIINTLSDLESAIPAIVKALHLNEFERERNNVELNKVNVGNVNKRAVYRAMHALLRMNKFESWAVYFGSAS